MKYVVAVLSWIWRALSFGSGFLPLVVSVGLYSGLAIALGSLSYGTYNACVSFYQSFQNFSQGLASDISGYFSNLQNNSWFSLISYLGSLDVVVQFQTEFMSNYLSVCVTSVLGIFASTVVISIGVLSVIWVRRRLRYILAGFGGVRNNG